MVEMKEKTSLGIAILLALAICLASGCIEGKPVEGRAPEGLVVSFQGIPSEAPENSNIPVSIVVENRGEEDISGQAIPAVIEYHYSDQGTIKSSLEDWLAGHNLYVETTEEITAFEGDYHDVVVNIAGDPGAMSAETSEANLRNEVKGVDYEKIISVSSRYTSKLCISGPVDVGGQRMSYIETLELKGARKIADTWLSGERKMVNLLASTPEVPGDTLISLSATVRYPYRTRAIANVCLGSSLLGQMVGQPACQPNEDKSVSNTGAPIQVTELKQITSSSEEKTDLIFLVKIQNIKEGFVYNSTTGFRNCVADVGENLLDYMNHVDVELARIGTASPIDLTCEPIVLTDNEGSTICNATIASPVSAYEEQLVLELAYNYVQTASQKINIRNMN